jgi:two-component system, chemotaxis family, sensor kinase CheA
MSDPLDKAREEFFSEAEELVETLSRNLLALDASQKAGTEDPGVVNEAFRAVHTLKGLCGLFGAKEMTTLSHRLEDILDALRLGKTPLDAAALDLLFTGVDVYNQLLVAERERSGEPVPAFDAFLARLDGGTPQLLEQSNALEEFDLDAGMLAVLTEYEEHRLRSNVELGRSLYRVRVQFDLMTIDKALEDLKARAKPFGEVITYLPTGDSVSPDTIELDILLASGAQLQELEEHLAGPAVIILEIPRRPSLSPGAAMTIPPSVRTGASEPSRQLSGAPNGLEPIEQAQAIRAVAQTVRVDIRKLDALMNVVGELAIVKGVLARIVERLRAEGQRPLATELHRVQRSFDRHLGELQGGILEVRMVPLGQVFDRLARVVRQISREVGKDIRLVITGAETEIDKLIVEELSDPLMHIVRNAIDHGIESTSVRERMGKPLSGTIALNAFQKGNHVVIEVEDDGRGIDETAVVERAVSMGKVDRGDVGELSRNEALALIFLPGVSTREAATDYSGRGVGMDVVKTNISRLGGIIDVHSETDIGTKFTITLPVTLAIVSALLVRIAGRAFAMPLTSVAEAIVFDERDVRLVDGREVITLRGATLPVCRLAEFFGLEHPSGPPRRRYVVVATLGARRVGFVVDDLHGQQDIVIKSLGVSLSKVRGFSGATELGDQRVALVLDPPGLVEDVLEGFERRLEERAHG